MKVLISILIGLFCLSLPLVGDEKSDKKQFETDIQPFFKKHCIKCHGPEKQKGDLRLDSLETIDAVDRQELFRKVQEVIRLAEMPPEKAKQPNEAERKVLLQWLNSQLTGKAANALAEKLRRFEYLSLIHI